MHLISLLFFLVFVAHRATSLSCNHCQDFSSWDACDRKNQVAQCNFPLTNDLHRNLINVNPSLPLAPPHIFISWRCYELAIHFVNESQTKYERGCTYFEADFCNGWDMNVLQPPVNCTLSYRGVPDVNDGGIDEGSGTEGAKGGTGRTQLAVYGWISVMFSIFLMMEKIYSV